MKRIEWPFIALVFLLAFLIRLNYSGDLFSLNLACANYDGVDYHWLGKNLCRLRGYHTFFGTGHDYHLLRLPGYPFYIAIVYSIARIDVLALRIADSLLSSFTVLLLYLIAKTIFGRGAAVAASLIALPYHQAVNFATRIFSENLFCFMLLLLVYLLIRYKQMKWSCAAGGFISGYMILIRPLWLGVLPFLILWIALSSRQRIGRIAIFAACLCLILMPWTIYCVWGLGMDFSLSIFSTTVGAENTWAAHNPLLGDFVQMGPTPGRDFEHEWQQLRLIRFANWKLKEDDYIDKLGAQAKSFFKADPLRCILLGLKRVYRHWLGSGILDGQGTILEDRGDNPFGIINWQSRFLNPGAYLSHTEVIDQLVVTRKLRIGPFALPFISFEGVFYVMVASTVLYSLLNLRRLPAKTLEFLRKNALILLIMVGYALTNVLGITAQRYRFPLDYFIILFCAAGIAGTGRSILCMLKAIAGESRAGWDSAEAPPGGGTAEVDEKGTWPGRRRTICLIVLILIAICMALSIRNLIVIRKGLAQRCGKSSPQEEQLARMQVRLGSNAVKPDELIDYCTAWERQMTGMGDLGELLGQPVLWTGEVTYLNLPSKVDFPGEVYLREAQERFAPGMPDPGFFRLIVDSYQKPDSIGSGRAIVIVPQEVLEQLKEGDRVAVLGRLGGTDYIVGSMIICATHTMQL